MEIYYPNKKIKLIIVGISILVLICSLTQTAFYVSKTDNPQWDSSIAFFLGWLGVLEGKAGISWLANPCLIFAWMNMVKNPRRSAIAGFFAVCFSALFLTFKKITVDEAGSSAYIVRMGSGYYLWVTSIAICFIGAIIVCFYENRNIAKRL